MNCHRSLATAAALLLAALLAPPEPAQAGCGCDHPPAAWAPVMPPFASPGKEIQLWGQGFEFVPGASYAVHFGAASPVAAVASGTSHVRVTVPPLAPPGPLALRVLGPGLDHSYERELFTVLSPAPQVPASPGVFGYRSFAGSVTTDGTLLVPVNVTDVLEATQFAVILDRIPLEFSAEDVIFFNADGVNLSLFTLSVDESTERQWGSYYGWHVHDDTNLGGRVFKNKRTRPWIRHQFSDVLHYWRHEFHTYRQAHGAGGTHEVDENGYHAADGTLHIDHEHLVLAIAGGTPDPSDATLLRPLSPGSRVFDVYLGAQQSSEPVEPGAMYEWVAGSLATSAVTWMQAEPAHAYRRDSEDDD